MQILIEPGKIIGEVKAPPSKSMSQRALAVALLQKGTTTIRGVGSSNDEKNALNVIIQLGATIVKQTEDELVIYSERVKPVSDTVDCGESGLAARLFTPIAALAGNPVSITGSGTLLKRPMYGFNQALTSLGIEIKDFNGYLPVTVHGPIESLSFRLNAGNGSQFLSGLLFAIAYSAKTAVNIEVADLKSKPYIDLTLDMLQQAGRPITRNDYTSFVIDPSLFRPVADLEIDIEGDWSAAANFLVAGAIAGAVKVTGLSLLSHQADREVLAAIKLAGAEVTEGVNCVTVKKQVLREFEFDATHCPDIFPILSILAACGSGESRINGIHRLYDKESNRVESIANMLLQFDVTFSIEEDSFCIWGKGELTDCAIDCYHDHRIVMAAAIGALCASGTVTIVGAEAVNKSYPAFFEHLSLCGVRWQSSDS